MSRKTINGGLIPSATNKQGPPDAFPLADVKEITHVLQGCEFHASEELIARPTAAYIRALYEHFLDVFKGIPPGLESRVTQRLSTLEKQESPSAQESDPEEPEGAKRNAEELSDIMPALTSIIFFKQCSKFFTVCGVYDLALLDIQRPEPRRTRRLLSAVVNYIRFREFHASSMADYVFKADELQERKRAKEAELTTKMNLKNTAEQKFGPYGEDGTAGVLRAIDAFNLKLSNELKKHKRQQEALDVQHQAYRVEKIRQLQLLSDANDALAEAAQLLDSKSRKSKIDVPAYEQKIQDGKQKSASLQAKLDALDQESRLVMGSIFELQKIVATGPSIMMGLEKVDSVIENIEKQLTLNQDLSSQLDQATASKGEVERTLQHIMKQCEIATQKIEKLRVSAQESRADKEHQLAEIRDQYAKLRESIEAQSKERAQKRKTIAECEALSALSESEWAAEQRNLAGVIDLLWKATMSYSDVIRNNLLT